MSRRRRGVNHVLLSKLLSTEKERQSACLIYMSSRHKSMTNCEVMRQLTDGAQLFSCSFSCARKSDDIYIAKLLGYITKSS
eukprot:4145928-Pyramimonas_sp.AAC.1